MTTTNLQRRQLLKALLALGLTAPLASQLVKAAGQPLITKPIPVSGEALPVIGVGSSRTFDSMDTGFIQERLLPVIQAFFDQGGALVDSSPMYGEAESVIGKLLSQAKGADKLFSATKVWIDGQQAGVEQMERSRQLWGIKRFDLMQIHNLRDWELHLETLKKMKAEGKVRYIGITTSHGRFHEELAELLKQHPFDFVQLTYNIDNRVVEQELLPIAKDKGIAVIVNRPYQKGDLFRQVKGQSLPDWAREIDVASWGQYFLKFVVSHPAVTCAIPATSKVKHMLDNMGAQYGRLPDEKVRQEMIRYLAQVS